MIVFEYKIKNLNNIHSRPLSELAKIVKDSKCIVMIKKGREIKDIKKIISMIQLKLKIGDNVEISIKGKDKELEEIAYKEIWRFFIENF